MGFAKRLWEHQREQLEAKLFDGGIGEVEFTEEALALDYTLEEISDLLAAARDESEIEGSDAWNEIHGQFGVGA